MGEIQKVVKRIIGDLEDAMLSIRVLAMDLEDIGAEDAASNTDEAGRYVKKAIYEMEDIWLEKTV